MKSINEKIRSNLGYYTDGSERIYLDELQEILEDETGNLQELNQLEQDNQGTYCELKNLLDYILGKPIIKAVCIADLSGVKAGYQISA